MIVFQTDTISLDLSALGITLNEQNNRFGNSIVKDYSFPFSFTISKELSLAFGLPTVNNISGYNSKIYGTVVRNNEFYYGYIKIYDIVGDKVFSTIYFGSETLAVYDVNLKNLPFEIVKQHAVSYANNQINKAWPEATHNYVQVYRDDISSNTNYESFKGFVNNYNNGFVTNTTENQAGTTVFHNNNVMVPMPYVMEVLKVGYGVENLELRGSFVEDSFNSKLVLVPDTFLEKYSELYSSVFSFTTPSLNYLAGDIVVSEYVKTLTYPSSGSYSFVFQINLPKELASFFSVVILQNTSTLFSFSSVDQDVKINEELTLNLSNSGSIKVVLKLNQLEESIENYTFFSFESKDGQLNVFPDSYNIADFMPDILFREFVNTLKNWLNLETYTYGNSVYINYIEKEMPATIFKSCTHLEVKSPKRKISADKVYALTYADGQEVKVNKYGVTYSDTSDVDLSNIEIPIIPLAVSINNDVLTASFNEETTNLKLCIYNGLQNGLPLAVETINGRSLALTQVVESFWKNWLNFRTNSEEIEEVVIVHKSEQINIHKGVFKNNQKMLIDKIKTKNINSEYNQVTINYETIMN